MLSTFFINSLNIFSPFSDKNVSLPLVLKLPPAITTGTLSVGSVVIFCFNSVSVSKLFEHLN